jgi:hypothetical protein
MKVTITDKCDRCKREAPKEIDSTEITKFEAADEKRAQACEAVSNAFKDLQVNWEGAVPDLVVFYKGEVKTISRVCDAFCDKTVKNQIGGIFRDIDVSKRKPRKVTSKEATDKAKDKKTKDSKAKKGDSSVEGKDAGTPAS